MNTLTWVITTSAFCWTGICLYLTWLAVKQHTVNKRLIQLAAHMEHSFSDKESAE